MAEIPSRFSDIDLLWSEGAAYNMALHRRRHRLDGGWVTDSPCEPPLAGPELAHLVGALERLCTTFQWKADDLDAASMRACADWRAT